METVFDSPQMVIGADSKPKLLRYGGFLLNELCVYRLDSRYDKTFFMNVPPELLTLLRTVGVSNELGDVWFSLDEGEDGKWYFGYEYTNTDGIVETRRLWPYAKGKLPGWIRL